MKRVVNETPKEVEVAVVKRRFLNARHLAEVLDVSVRTIQRWRDAGMPYVRVPPDAQKGMILFYLPDVERWLLRGRQNATGRTKLKLEASSVGKADDVSKEIVSMS